ncbi:MAG: GH3 auxin-responsive promoter family protein [Anaerolineales bacterium]|nr:MAG: GH3 auxin-responsive promoter family protein [Anaerolineales bacterium]
MVSDPKAMIDALLQPWYQALEDPPTAQRQVLDLLLEGYAQTDYGARRGAGQIRSIEEYRTAFPVVTYQDLQPVLRRVMEGDTAALVAEPVEGWALTRGAAGRESRYIPMTRSDLALRARYSPRALLNYVHRKGRYDILEGYCLIQTSPSEVGTLKVGDRQIRYGYSSGLYARQGAPGAQLRLVPTQDEIDALGSGQTRLDWERRFDLIYRRAKDKPVTMLVGVAQNMLKFGEFCRGRHGVYPKDIWQMSVLVPTSVAGILTRYRPALRALYGDVDLAEMYATTEAIFAQQRDERPYVVPNYDGLLFEAQTRRGMVMLHDMYRGERGSLVVSTPILPRYRIGDVVMCYGQPYFRCLGRERGYHPLRFAFDSFLNSDWESVALMLR